MTHCSYWTWSNSIELIGHDQRETLAFLAWIVDYLINLSVSRCLYDRSPSWEEIGQHMQSHSDRLEAPPCQMRLTTYGVGWWWVPAVLVIELRLISFFPPPIHRYVPFQKLNTDSRISCQCRDVCHTLCVTNKKGPGLIWRFKGGCLDKGPTKIVTTRRVTA